MIVWNTAKKFAQSISAKTASKTAVSRRAINLLPSPAPGQQEVVNTTGLKYHQLLITLEGNKKTGVLKVINPKRRSRAAILIYRGRVLGCIYGRKGQNGQFMHCEAHRCAVDDLATGGNLVDLYPLPDDLALATAALFHGTVLPPPPKVKANWQFDWALAKVCAAGKPGCVVIGASPAEMAAVVYASQGRIIGVYNEATGWMQPKPESAHNIIKGASFPVQISACVLMDDDFESLTRLSFSLTGLADRQRFQERMLELQAVDDLVYHSDYLPTISTYSHLLGLLPAGWKTQPSAPRAQQTFAIQP
ncbi:MAG: hypothetical protein U0105_00210 [Candidatus Obscuribacterales bacterium]